MGETEATGRPAETHRIRNPCRISTKPQRVMTLKHTTAAKTKPAPRTATSTNLPVAICGTGGGLTAQMTGAGTANKAHVGSDPNYRPMATTPDANRALRKTHTPL